MPVKTLTLTLEDLQSNSFITESGCWEWMGARRWNRGGYGVVSYGDPRSARIDTHRAACYLAYGDPPHGKPWALHACNNPPCCNPAHLRWGSPAENTADTKAAGRSTGGRAGATHCMKGHEFTEENTYWEPRGWGRACKECRREAVRRSRARRKAAMA